MYPPQYTCYFIPFLWGVSLPVSVKIDNINHCKAFIIKHIPLKAWRMVGIVVSVQMTVSE